MKKIIKISLISFLLSLILYNGFIKLNVVAEETSSLSLELLGDETIYLLNGSTYQELGAMAIDSIDGNITSQIIIDSSQINNMVNGTYYVNYSVTNSRDETKTISRKVIVEYGYTTTERSYPTSYSNNGWKKVIPTSDGNFLAIGQNRYELIFWKFNSNLEVIWSKNYCYTSSYHYAKDIIEDVNKFYILYSYNTSSCILTIDKNGNALDNTWLNYEFDTIKIISENKVLLLDSNNTVACFYDSNLDSYQIFWLPSIYYSDGFVSDNKFFYISSGNIVEYDLNTEKYNFYNTDYLKIYKDNYIYAYKNNCIAMLDENFFEIKVININFANISIINDTNYIVIKDNNTFTFFNKDDLSFYKKNVIQVNDYSLNNFFILKNGSIGFLDNYSYKYSYYDYLYYKVIYLHDLSSTINGLHETTIPLNSNINFNENIFVEDKEINFDIHHLDDSEFDNSKAGNYNIYYTIYYFNKDETIKTIQATRKIIVEHETSIENNTTYDGSIILDVLGGTIKINDVLYEYNDVFNLPGVSTLVIEGLNGYQRNITVNIEPVIVGVENNCVYYNTVTPIISGGELYLDGEVYVSGTPISTKGYHKLEIKNSYNDYYQSIDFTIEPTIAGVENDYTYYESITPLINAESMTLNGATYNGETIDNCGNYTLVINGTLGYEKTINFVIESIVSNITNNETYQASVTPTFTKGHALLNGNEYYSGIEITTPGNNVLVINGEGGYQLVYNFTINEEVDGVSNSSIYTGSVTPVISGGDLTLNGEPYTSGTIIDVPGRYTLEIKGANEFSKKIVFILKPKMVNVNNGGVYNRSVIPAVSKGTLLIDDLPYESGSVINTSGQHTLKIIGVNGYYEEIKFTLLPGVNILDNASYVNEVTLHFVGTGKLNGVSINAGFIVDSVGNYTFELTDGENVTTYNFKVEPDYSIFDEPIVESFAFVYKNATVTINDKAYTSNETLNEIGNYYLVIDGLNGYHKEVDFTIDPYVSINNGDEFIDEAVVVIRGCDAYIDNTLYVNQVTINEIGNHKIEFQGINEYLKTINYTINPSISDIENYGYYFNEVCPTINATNLLLDNEEYISGTPINKVGVHTLEIKGLNDYSNIINFIILPSDFNVLPNQFYEEQVSVFLDGVSIYIDDVLYTSNTLITEYGKHVIKFSYNGGFSSYEFYILPTISGVTNNGIYENNTTITTTYPYLILNNQNYTSGTLIDEIGYYTLVIMNLNGYDHTINFTICEKYIGLEDGGSYIGEVTPVISNGSLTLDGESFTSGTVINKVGYHTLTINGINGYENTIEFTVTEDIQGIEHNQEYTYSTIITVPNATLELNGNSFSSGNTIYTVGNHNLKIYGTNGYVSEYSFVIKPRIYFYVDGITTEFIEGKTYNDYNYIYFGVDYCEKMSLNGSDYSSYSYIYNIGNYNLKIYGINDYVYELNFTKAEIISGITQNGEYDTSVYLSCNNAKSLILNNQSIYNNTRIYTIGNNILEVVGVGDYKVTYNFVIKPYFYTSGSNYNYINENSPVHNSDIGVRINVYDSYNSCTLNRSYYEKMEINGVEYTNNKNYYLVGNNTFTIYGINDYQYSFDFVITEYIENFYNYVQKEAFSPKIRLGENNSYSDDTRYVELDGKKHDLNSLISEVGHHIFTVYGANGYKKEIHFTILPTISGIEDNGLYNNIQININHCDLLIDSNDYYSNTLYNKVGYHTLSIIGTNNYFQTYNFTIIPSNVDKYENKEFIKELIIDDIENCDIYFKDTPYTLGSTINIIGNHKVDIKGDGNYIQSFELTIKEEPNITTEKGKIEFVDGFVAQKMVKIDIPKANLYIDDKPYISNSEFVEIGNHKLTIEGINDYKSEYTFTIDVELDIIEGNEYDSKQIIAQNYNQLILDGKPIESPYPVSTYGNHVLQVMGTNGYEKTYKFSIKLNCNLINNEVHSDMVIPEFNAERATLNGLNFESGQSITKCGYYKLTLYSVDGNRTSYDFTVESKLKNQVGTTYKDYQILCDNAVNLKLNGESVQHGFRVTNYGSYTLVIEGENGYQESYGFDIELDVEGLINNKTYDTAVIPTFNSENALLNNVEFTTNTPISKAGHYNLKIKGDGGIQSEYNFTIDAQLEDYEQNAYYDQFTIKCNNATLLLLNGATISNNSTVDQFGKHYLIIKGENNYQKLFSFNINLNISGVINNLQYDNKVSATFNSTNAYLNGKYYQSNDDINEVGNHILKVVGVNNVYQEIHFTINDKIQGLEETTKNSYTIIPEIPCSLYIDGIYYKEINNFKQVGKHTLTIKGVNEYSKDLTFTVTEVLDIKETYEKEFNLYYSGFEVYIDDIQYKSGSLYKLIGNHTLKVKGTNDYTNEYRFCITPIIDGLSKVGVNVFTGSKTINLDNARLILNGNEITSGTEVDTIGINTLRVLGDNDYETEYTFLIKPIIEQIANAEEYEGSASWKITGKEQQVLLDGVSTDKLYTTYEIGNHELTIIGLGGYKETIKFTIKPVLENITKNTDLYKRIELKIIGNGNFILDGNPVKLKDNIFKCDTIGTHKLVIEGRDYEYTYPFELKPDINLIENYIYQDFVNIVFNNKPSRVELNGKQVNNSQLNITTSGNHTIKVYGTNEYVKSYNFTLIETLNFINYGKYHYGFTVEKVNARMFIDDVEIHEDTYIEGHGKHTVKVVGNEYEMTYCIEIINDNINFVIIGVGVLSTTLIILFVVLIKRKKVI